MNRKEHLQWCKERALEYARRGNLPEALSSMVSDLGKHPETASSCDVAMMLSPVALKSQDEMIKFIEGFN
ncbi:MAG TPA: hypothetical protein VF719_07220 [Abditibacteriaceae bacterium]